MQDCCNIYEIQLLRRVATISMEIDMSNEITSSLFNDIQKLIESAKQHLSREFNLTYVLLNWHIGKRVNQVVLNEARAEYGKRMVKALASQLQAKYGRGYDQTSLSRMIKFAKVYPEEEIVATLSQQLSWSHIVKLITISDPLKRDFYAELCALESWSIRTFSKKINSMLYERTVLSKKPEDTIKKDLDNLKQTKTLTSDFVFHDPYFLDFAGLKQDYSEQDLENAILDELTKFIQEMGNDFCFVDRQKRMNAGSKDRYLDLLFFHRSLQRLIAIELKIGAFEPSHKGQMEWYLNWLDKHERKQNEDRPLGIILCADKDQEDVEYLELDASGIHVAQYLTELPAPEVLEQKLRKAIEIAREKHACLDTLSSKDNIEEAL
jgi:predicted nuclease of restriction endonuclease-like (RecB) superfamily